MNGYSKGLLLVLKNGWVALVIAGVVGFGDAAAQGEKLFKQNCSSCHKVDADMTGPALKGVQERWEGKKELLYQWVKNPAAVKEMGDPYVNKLLAEWEPKGGLMTAQAVSNDEIDQILDYVKNWEPEEESAGTTGAPTAQAQDEDGLSATWLLIILFILLILVFSLLGVRSSLSRINNAMRVAEGKDAKPEYSFREGLKNWFWENKVFASVIAVLVVVYLVVAGYEELMEVGVYEGYQPSQPIKFNHMLHAGENEVACVYCHGSAQKSKHAGIPSANICMNCHTGINEGQSDEGTAEIQKIYDAVGWDLETRSYTGEEKPIKWVKVHNLPDHVYFNHAQHYEVGNIQCQECHGQVQDEYTVGKQFAPLTMGWCIECHNETQVTLEGNGYYEEIHERLVDHGKEDLKNYLEDGAITAKELGGWECAKCHY